MERLARAGKARFIGVSNVTLEQLELLVREAEVAPAFVQNRCYARAAGTARFERFAESSPLLIRVFPC